MNGMTHREIQELLGVYVLDAVDADEAAIVEDHLHQCDECRAEVEASRDVVARLAESFPETEPPVDRSLPRLSRSRPRRAPYTQ